MQFGITEVDLAAEAAKMGFDYLEVNASQLAQLPEEAFAQKLSEIQASGLKAETSNCLFPNIPLLTDEGKAQAEEYLPKAFQRLGQLGVRLAVFGSGGARCRPEGMAFDEAWRRLRDIAGLVGGIAGEYGIAIALEPLRRAECNMINTVTEAAALAAAVNLPNLWVLADSFHMLYDREPLENIGAVGRLSHVHAALRDGRCYPTYPEGRLRLFMDQLHAIGYDGRVTIEAGTRCFAHDAPLALETLRAR